MTDHYIDATGLAEAEPPFDPFDEVASGRDYARGVRGHTWRDVDIADVVARVADGTYQAPAPVMGEIAGGAALLYEAKLHIVFGIGGSCKTWIAAYLLAERLKLGEHVLLVDLEDGPATIAERLLLHLGVPADAIAARFHYKRPSEPSRHGRDELLDTIRAYRVSLVVIDSFGEALAADGINQNADDEVAVWVRMIARPLADAGATVALLDHLPKADEYALMPIGSQRKAAAADGALYAVQIVKPPSREIAGHVKIVCGKDRQGAYRRGDTVAELHLEPEGRRTRVRLSAPQDGPRNADGTFRPTYLMERVSIYLESTPGATKNAIAGAVKGKRGTVLDAVSCLVTDGFVKVDSGKNNSQLHSSIKPYRQTDETGTTQVVPGGVSGSGSLRTGTGEPPTEWFREPPGNHLGTGEPLPELTLHPEADR